jgi:hypothetical protein
MEDTECVWQMCVRTFSVNLFQKACITRSECPASYPGGRIDHDLPGDSDR